MRVFLVFAFLVGCNAQSADWVASSAVPVTIGKSNFTAVCVVQGVVNVTDRTIFQWSNGSSIVPKSGRYIITVQETTAGQTVNDIVNNLNSSWIAANTTVDVTNPSLVIQPGAQYAVLSILFIRKDEVGKVLCSNTTGFDVTSQGHVEMGAGMKATKNVIQGDEYCMTCEAFGNPLPAAIQWRKDGQLIATDSRVRYRDNTTSVNMTLEFVLPTGVEFSDDGEYTCFAVNAIGSSNNQTMVMRVKDRWAALWPFLGIVAEVIVLCTAILLYEKRQQAKMAAEEDEKDDQREETAPMTSDTEPQTGDDVRQRTSAKA